MKYPESIVVTRPYGVSRSILHSSSYTSHILLDPRIFQHEQFPVIHFYSPGKLIGKSKWKSGFCRQTNLNGDNSDCNDESDSCNTCLTLSKSQNNQPFSSVVKLNIGSRTSSTGILSHVCQGFCVHLHRIIV